MHAFNNLKFFYLLVLVTTLLSCANPAVEQKADLDKNNPKHQIAIGKVLFERHCLQCHRYDGTDNQMLNHIQQSTYDDAFIYQYILHQDSLLKAKHPLALELNQKWNHLAYRHAFPFTKAEIDAILMFLRQ